MSEAFINDHLLSIIVAAPMVAAILLLMTSDDAKFWTRAISFVGAVISFAGSVQVALLYDRTRGGLQLPEKYPLVPSLGIDLSLAVDGWGVAQLLLTGIIIVTGT